MSQNGYIGIWKGKRCEVYADTLYQAKQLVSKELSVPKKQEHMISVILVEVDGKIITQSTI